MSWDAVGAIADLASAVMVAVSLVYLAVQVREFRRQADIELAMHFQENEDRIRSEIWTNPEVASFLERCATNSEPLPASDRRRFRTYLIQRLFSMRQMFEHAPKGAWDRIRHGLRVQLAGRAAAEIWEEIRVAFPPDFQREIDVLIGPRDSPA